MELNKRAAAIKVYYKCDECDEGFLSFNGQVRKGINNTFFYHKCNHCKKVFELTKQYPAVKFEDMDTLIKNEEVQSN